MFSWGVYFCTMSYDQSWLVVNQKGKTATIDIEGPIGGSFFEEGVTKEQLKADLNKISEIKATKIIVNIDSLGGLVNHGLSIHDLLASHEAEKEVRITGMTSSIATVIAMAGDTIHMSDNAMFLIHKARGIAIGDDETMEGARKDLKTTNNRIANTYSKSNRKGNDVNKILGWMANSKGLGEWWSPDQAKEKGFIDEIFEPAAKQKVAMIDEETLKNAHLPQLPKKYTKSKDMKISDQIAKSFKDVKETIVNAISKANDEGKPLGEEAVKKLIEDLKPEDFEKDTKVEKELEDLKAEKVELETEAKATAEDLKGKDARISLLEASEGGEAPGSDPGLDNTNTQAKDGDRLWNFLSERRIRMYGNPAREEYLAEKRQEEQARKELEKQENNN